MACHSFCVASPACAPSHRWMAVCCCYGYLSPTCAGYLDYPFKNPTFSTVCFLSSLILLFISDAGKLSHGMHPIFLLKGQLNCITRGVFRTQCKNNTELNNVNLSVVLSTLRTNLIPKGGTT